MADAVGGDDEAEDVADVAPEQGQPCASTARVWSVGGAGQRVRTDVGVLLSACRCRSGPDLVRHGVGASDTPERGAG